MPTSVHRGRADHRLTSAVLLRGGVALFALALVALPARRAQAQDADGKTVGTITLLNRKAIEAYQYLNFEEAQRLLRQAMELSQRPSLLQHPIRARTCITLGMVMFGGFKQRDAAITLFRQALEITPEIRLIRGLANPQIQEVFDEAVRGLANEGRPPPTVVVAEPPLERVLLHEPVRIAVRGRAIPLEASLDGHSTHELVVVGYRAAGAAVFAEVRMQRQPPNGVFAGAIPATATAGGQVEYYVEARRMDGKRLASRGSSVEPMVVALSSAAPEAIAAAAVISETPAIAIKGSDDNRRRFVLALLAGTGLGWTSGVGEVRQVPVAPSGIAWASLAHLAPEIGYFATPHLMLAAQGRFQLVSGATEYRPTGPPTPGVCGGDGVCSPAKAAFAGFAKAAWFFNQPASAFRPYVSLSLGGGLIRHLAQAGNKTDCGATQDQKCQDTVAGGPFLFGTGIGFSYQVSDGVALVFALEGLGGVPNFTVEGDANLGVAFRL